MKNYDFLFSKQAILLRMSNALSIPLQKGFLVEYYQGYCTRLILWAYQDSAILCNNEADTLEFSSILIYCYRKQGLKCDKK